jgi:hypothetical protein
MSPDAQVSSDIDLVGGDALGFEVPGKDVNRISLCHGGEVEM